MRKGAWLCFMADGCYPEDSVITTRWMEDDEAEALCRRLHDMDKVCAVVKTAQ